MTLGVPATAEFSIVDIQDPQSCPQTVADTPALYRRPLPATNLVFLADVMWDGRQRKPGQSLNDSLAGQASAATFIHAEATRPPTPDQLAAIVAFQTGLFTAQQRDRAAGLLTAQNARGGARNLSQQPFFPGINDPDNNPTGAAFDPLVFNIYRSWEKLKGKGGVAAARQSVARGEILFNMFPIAVTGVAGMNDLPGKGTVVTTCSGCHTTPNVGNHSSTQLLNIGTSDYPARPGLDISGLPVYTLQCNTVSPPSSVQSTDPGLAMITGRCADISKIKNPILRGLAARAPYFHNGSAATLSDVVNFYDRRFNMNLDLQQKTDLAAFLSTL
jgi:hypothetical protein